MANSYNQKQVEETLKRGQEAREESKTSPRNGGLQRLGKEV
jgi:hypothetical protein